MKQTLEALWNGNIAPGATNGVNDPDMERLTVLMDRNREKLTQTLSAEQKAVFDSYADCADEFQYLSSVHAFCDGFPWPVSF